MAQPYHRSVGESFETAILIVGGVFSHAVTKGPLLARGEVASSALFEQETISTHEPTAEEPDAARLSTN